MLNPQALAILAGPTPVLVMLVEMGFSTVLRMASSAVDIEWNGQTWLRTGNLGGVEAVKDTGGEVAGLRFSLSGVPSESVALALGESARNKSCVVYLAVLDPQTHAVVDVQTMWRGSLDQMPVSEDGNNSSIGVTALHRAKLFQRTKPLRYTDGDQKKLYPGDRGLEYLLYQSSHQDVWPAAAFFKQ